MEALVKCFWKKKKQTTASWLDMSPLQQRGAIGIAEKLNKVRKKLSSVILERSGKTLLRSSPVSTDLHM